jgi:hypothetical protein
LNFEFSTLGVASSIKLQGTLGAVSSVELQGTLGVANSGSLCNSSSRGASSTKGLAFGEPTKKRKKEAKIKKVFKE